MRNQDNIIKIEEMMRKKTDGLTLNEKIEKELEKVKKKAKIDTIVSHMGDTFFKQVEENGNLYYLRRTNLLRDNGRTLNIVDEIGHYITSKNLITVNAFK